MDRQVELRSATETRSASGERVLTWATFATVWADLRHKAAREIDVSAQHLSQGEMIVFIRYRTDVTARQQVKVGAEIYDIQNVREIGRGEGLELLCVRFAG